MLGIRESEGLLVNSNPPSVTGYTFYQPMKRLAKLLCMVNSAPDFGQQPLVANGATDLLSELYGDARAHAMSAVGMAALPNQACVEIEMILEIED